MSRAEKFSRALRKVADAVDVFGLATPEEEPANLEDSDTDGYEELEKLVGFRGVAFFAEDKLGMMYTALKREEILEKVYGKKYLKELRKLKLSNGDEVWYPRGTSVTGNIAQNTKVTTVVISVGDETLYNEMTREEYIAFIAVHGKLDEDPPILPEMKRTAFRAL